MKTREESRESPRKRRHFGIWNEERIGPLFLLVVVVGTLVERIVYLSGPVVLA